MITGAIAGVFIIAMIAAGSNGEWGSVAICTVLIVLVLLFGKASRDHSEAYNNFIDYWANKSRYNGSRSGCRLVNSLKRKQDRWRQEDAREPDPSLVNGVKTAGTMRATQGTELQCIACSRMMSELSRISYSSGATYVTYYCQKCKRRLPVRI